MQHKTVVLGTGGTIAGLSQASGGYVAGALGLDALLPPDMAQGLEQVNVCQIDSKDLCLMHWQALLAATLQALAREDVGSVLITHGTDTMEETAWLFQVLARHSCKPVVLTGAMRPADHLSPDGPGNLHDALAVARHPDAQGRGVLVVMNGEVHAAREVRKVHGWALDAFSCGLSGAVGRVHEGKVHWQQAGWLAGELAECAEVTDLRWASAQPLELDVRDTLRGPSAQAVWHELERGSLSPELRTRLQACLQQQAWPWVEMVISGAEAQVRSVQALLAAGLQGLVVVATGSGTVHQGLELALSAVKTDTPVVLCTGTELSGMLPTQPAYGLGVSTLTPRKTRLTLALWCMLQADGKF